MYDNLPDNYMNVMTQTRDYIGNHSNIIRDYLKQFDIDYAEAFQKEMKNFDASKESADLWRAAINEYDNNYNGVVQKFRSKGIDPNMIMTDRDSAITKVYEMMRADRIYNKLNEKTFGFDCLVQDIIDAVYGGLPINNPSVAGGQIRFGHFSDYYQSLDFDDYLKRRFNEQMANFYSLKRNAPEKLSKLKELLGDDCYQMFKTYAQKNYKWKS